MLPPRSNKTFLVGWSHAVDGQDSVKIRGHMRRALQQGFALASPQGNCGSLLIHRMPFLVAGDWNMTLSLVNEALQGMDGGEWQVHNTTGNNDWIVSNYNVVALDPMPEIHAWRDDHYAQVARVALPATSARKRAHSECKDVAEAILAWVREQRARATEVAGQKQGIAGNMELVQDEVRPPPRNSHAQDWSRRAHARPLTRQSANEAQRLLQPQRVGPRVAMRGMRRTYIVFTMCRRGPNEGGSSSSCIAK